VVFIDWILKSEIIDLVKLYIKSIEMNLPSQKTKVSETPYLSPEQQKVLLENGYDEYYLASPSEDAIELAVAASKKVLAQLPGENPDFVFYHQLGTVRCYGDWTIVSYVQSRLDLQKSVGLFINSMCTSFTMALRIFQGFALQDPNVKSALIPISAAIIPPFAKELANTHIEKKRGIVFGALGMSAWVTNEPTEIELVEVSPTICNIEGESWNYPSVVEPFQFSEGEVVGGGSAHVSFDKSENYVKDKQYISPTQRVIAEVTQLIGKAVHKHGIKEMELSCLPVGALPIHEMIGKAVGIKITANPQMYQKYGHVGACDPMVAIYDVIQEKKSGYFCHLCIGQGYTGSFVIFKR
jgi:3-oxoacyl-[acyl-carrier-protein] synthase III